MKRMALTLNTAITGLKGFSNSRKIRWKPVKWSGWQQRKKENGKDFRYPIEKSPPEHSLKYDPEFDTPILQEVECFDPITEPEHDCHGLLGSLKLGDRIAVYTGTTLVGEGSFIKVEDGVLVWAGTGGYIRFTFLGATVRINRI